jgi:hypothetical protein
MSKSKVNKSEDMKSAQKTQNIKDIKNKPKGAFKNPQSPK